MKALILIDFQNEWISSISDYYVGNIDELLLRVNNLIQFCRNNKYKIIFTKHIEKNPENGFNKEGSQLIKNIDNSKEDCVIEKNHISPFFKTTLDKELKDVDEVFVCGILTNLCVRSFVEGAYDRELKITIIEDCCVAFSEEIHKFTLQDLKTTREEIEIKKLEEI